MFMYLHRYLDLISDVHVFTQYLDLKWCSCIYTDIEVNSTSQYITLNFKSLKN